LFARPANVLVLDEPTNDLDIESLELLEDTLQGYTGTLLLVSHDRAFLDNVVTQTLVAELPLGNGVWKEYAGGYSDWLVQRRGSAAAVTPSPSAKPAAIMPREKPRIKMSFKEQRELESLPAELDALEREQQALTTRMSSADYHKQGADAIKADRKRAEEIEHQLAARFERWATLDEKATQVAS